MLDLPERLELFNGRLSAREVVRLDWINDELTATSAARQRLADWASDGQPDPSPDAITYAGDAAIHRLVVDALEKTPPPVRHSLARHALIIGIGQRCAGQCEIAPVLPANLEFLISFTAQENEYETAAVLLHEIAHAWLREPPTAPAPASAADRLDARLPFVVDALGGWNVIREHERRSELAATALARRWGGRGRAADVSALRRRYARPQEIPA